MIFFAVAGMFSEDSRGKRVAMICGQEIDRGGMHHVSTGEDEAGSARVDYHYGERLREESRGSSEAPTQDSGTPGSCPKGPRSRGRSGVSRGISPAEPLGVV